MHPLRSFIRPAARTRRAPLATRAFRSRRTTPHGAEGRWSLIEARVPRPASDTEWSAAVAQQLLTRYGIVTREAATAEGVLGGFSGVYDVFRTMEERGRLRRGYFASGVGATQFALPAALDRLRSLRDDPEEPEAVALAATDPANPYGAILRWPAPDTSMPAGTRGATRSVGAQVVLVNGALGSWVGRLGRQVLSYLPESEPDRATVGRAVTKALADLARGDSMSGMLIEEINGAPVDTHPLAPFLTAAGFLSSAMGYHAPRDKGSVAVSSSVPTTPRHRSAARVRTLRSSPFAALRRAIEEDDQEKE
jgi:ATP-dependent Lhr-like helicase